jgi:4-hydroxy-tetrahydrodipicolinate reductase
MNILILGYGKMGKTIEGIAKERGHNIKYIIDASNIDDLINIKKGDVDVAIEFSQPEAAFENIKTCVEKGIPVVSGTTGWLDRKKEIEEISNKSDTAFFYASNFSIGVNIFFKVNKFLAKMMDSYPEYNIKMEEIHHIEKKDAPSGTAITLAEGVLENNKNKSSWTLAQEGNNSNLIITAKRIDKVPGTHTVEYISDIDTIEIKHTAHSRKGFALGAVLVAEWLPGKKGSLEMDDFLNF